MMGNRTDGREMKKYVSFFLLALALGVSGVWAWTVRKRRPRVSRAVRWGLALYLLAGALGWAVFLSSEEGPRHPEWFGWGSGETAEEASP